MFHISKAIHANEKKFGRVLEYHKRIDLVLFDWHVMSSSRHNDVITIGILDFYQILPIKIKMFRDVSDFQKRKTNDKNWKENFILNTNKNILNSLSCT